jgi:hypothetical protein
MVAHLNRCRSAEYAVKAKCWRVFTTRGLEYAGVWGRRAKHVALDLKEKPTGKLLDNL